MNKYMCNVCGNIYDEEKEGKPWRELPDDWECSVCDSGKSMFEPDESPEHAAHADVKSAGTGRYLGDWERPADEREVHMADIHRMAETGESISEPMRAGECVNTLWDKVYIKGAQLAGIPLNEDVDVNVRTVIGPKAKHPMVIETPVYVTHMSYGALSKEAKLALAKGSADAKTAMCSGEGGILPESRDEAYKYVFEYVPNEYSVTDENLSRVDAIEIKVGQSAKPGMGGHLPAKKVTGEIAEIRGRPEGRDIVSPAHFKDISNRDDLRTKVTWLRERSGGKPIGIKFAAGHVEADLDVALYAEPDFITIDGRAGGTGSAPKFAKNTASVPTLFALYRARKFLDEKKSTDVSLLITGGLRVSSDFAKAFAMGADGVAIGTSAMMAIGCQQYRSCHTGKCPVGITSQNPDLRKRLDVDESAGRLANFLKVCTEELKGFARMTGNDDIKGVSVEDMCTADSEISSYTSIEHV